MTIQQNSLRPAARVGHKKSRTGCLKCRIRRVKCDETAPICANCQRLGLPCQYSTKSKSTSKAVNASLNPTTNKVSFVKSNLIPSPSPSSTNLSTPLSTTPLSSNGTENEKETPPAKLTKDKHTELRLLHAFMSKTIPPPGGIESTVEWRRIWFIEMPRVALDHDNLLYALLAFVAQIQGSISGSSEMLLSQAEYFTLALQEQQAALANPESNVEAKTLAAIMIAMCAFGMLRGRELQPYSPPADWLEVSRGAWHVSDFVEDLVNSPVLQQVVDITASVWMKWSRMPDPDIDMRYAPILTHLISEEFESYGGDAETGLATYNETLALLTEFRQAVTREKPSQHNIWRISLIAQTVSDDFVRFVRQERPRALVITASIFAVISRTGVLKVFGDADCSIPRCEIQAIQRVLPPEWQELMLQALQDLASIDE